MILFDDVAEILYDKVPIQKVEMMTDRQYFVRGCMRAASCTKDMIAVLEEEELLADIREEHAKRGV